MDTQKTAKRPAREVALISVIAAVYVAITYAIQPFAYGAFQFRVSEGLNHLAVFNKRYIWALTIGVFIANMFSPLGLPDMIFGTLGTLAMTTMAYFATRKVKSVVLKLVISTVIDTAMMWVVALELHLILHLPFWINFLYVAVGEFFSLAVGALLVYLINKRLDLAE
jgi:uncharacterized membrane protein